MVNVRFISLERKVNKSLCEWWKAASSAGVQLVLDRLDPLFSTICGQILLVAFGQAVLDMLKWILTFFEVSLSSDSRNRTTTLPLPQNRPFRPPMTVHFSTQTPLSSLGMPSGPDLIFKVRHGAVKLKIYGVYGVQVCAYSISLPVSPFLTIFRRVSTKFFSPWPKLCLLMPSDLAWIKLATINWVTSIFYWWLWVETGVEVAKSGLDRLNHANQQIFESLEACCQVSWVLTPSASRPCICGAAVSFILL